MPDAKTWEQKLIRAKIEDTYGVDAVPAAGDAVLAFDVNFDPNVTTPIVRDPVKPTIGAVHQPQALRHAALDFAVELVSSGAAGTAPKIGPVLQSAALGQYVTAGTKVEYKPVDTAEKSASAYFDVDGILHKLLGFRMGETKLSFMAGAVPRISGKGLALYAAPTDTAIPAVDWSSWRVPKALAAGLTTFSIHGYAAILHKLDIDLGVQVRFRDKVNDKRVDFVARRPTKGTATFEVTALATFNPFAREVAETTGALQLVHGTVAGDIVQLDCPRVQILKPRYEAVDDALYVTCDLNIQEVAGNDEFVLTCK